MTKRYGATVVPMHTARKHRVEAVCGGTEYANYSGGCKTPVYLPVVGVIDGNVRRLLSSTWDYAPGHGFIVDPEWIAPKPRTPDAALVQHAELRVRCRKCSWCLKQRGREWAARSVDEIGKSQRTWFVTLTLTPAMQFQCLAQARALATRRCVDLDEMDEGYIFRHRCTVVGAEITKWLKRVRKNSNSKLRYVLVAEAHKSGDPHFHALLHECFGSSPLTYRAITDAWKWGFSSAKLVPHDEARKAAWYTSKYLAKSALARIRASARYGRTGQ